MTQSLDGPVASSTPDCERLDVFHVAVEFQVLAATIAAGHKLGALRDQLDRASVSIVLNIAEGSAHFARGRKANDYAIARGSAMECLAVLNLLQARGVIAPDVYRRGRGLRTRVVSMLTRLIERFRAR
jgi:four helix bundle protein